MSSAMRHAYHEPAPAQYDLRRAAIFPEPANVTGPDGTGPDGTGGEALVIRHGHVLTMDRQLGDLPGTDVHIDGGRIIAVGPALHVPGARVLDARGMIVAPGLVDTHWHMWNTLLRSNPAMRVPPAVYRPRAPWASRSRCTRAAPGPRPGRSPRWHRPAC